MIRLTQAISAVMAGTVSGGLAGGIVGAAIGRISPSFVASLAASGFSPLQAGFEATEFGAGLGAVSGLFLGAGASLTLAVVLAIRDAWLARAGLLATRTIPQPAWD